MSETSAHVGLTPEQLQRAREYPWPDSTRYVVQMVFSHIATLESLLAQSQRVGERAAVDLADAATRLAEQAKRIHELEAERDRLREAMERASTLLSATARFMETNPIAAEYTVLYDEAQCDGGCLADDCRIALSEIAALDGKEKL